MQNRGMREPEVVSHFIRWLEEEGWSCRQEVDGCDIVAERGGAILYAEAKGDTKAPGLDVDTLYGQLLRRSSSVGGSTTLGVVVPVSARAKALRVSAEIRSRLGIVVFVVAEDGAIEEIGGL